MSNYRRFACGLISLWLVGVNPVLAEKTVSAELVWVDSQPESHSIMVSKLDSQQWSDPVTVYSSDKPIVTAAISTDHDGKKTLMWSEQQRTKMILMQMQQAGPEGPWRQAEFFNSVGLEDLGPSLIVDTNNTTWAFWSSNPSGQDDIYFANNSGISWTEPKLLHQPNKVPDFQPIASLSQQGNVIVEWKTYDMESGVYITVNQLFELDKSEKNGYKRGLIGNDDAAIVDVNLPNFLPRDSAVLLHFPDNQLSQSIRLDLMSAP